MADEIGCRSVAFTYNDPTIFWEYAADVADACHERGIKAISVTAGYMCPRPRAEFYRHIDAANVDLKAFTEEFYHRVCVGHLADVLDTLVYLRHETDVWVEITTLLIPGLNDSDAEIAARVRMDPGQPRRRCAVAFHRVSPRLQDVGHPADAPETLTRARRIGLAEGLRFVYTGNVHDLDGDTTRCPGCGDAVVVRDWYAMRHYGLTDSGRCERCGTQLPGVYDGPVGTWGARRLPVLISR